jgi:hypothetical protein
MQISHILIKPSPIASDRMRISAEVSYDHGKFPQEISWYDFPEEFFDGHTISGDPWLAAYLPLAMTLGEPLHISAPVDRSLFDGLQQAQEIWHSWYPDLRIVPIDAEVADTPLLEDVGRTAGFFSGGVDSFFTLLRNTDPANAGRITPIDDLLLVWGFDISLENEEAFQRMRVALRKAAAEFGKKLSDVATNLRQTRFKQANWGQLAHGAALASVGLHLEHRYRRLLIPSSGGYKELLPWGSHVLTDPLFSTRRMRVMQDGAAFSRGQKLEQIAASPVVQQYLRVCWRSGTDQNCGKCGKCLRAMVALEVLGFLERCSTFPKEGLTLRSIAKIYYEDPHMIDRGWDLHRLVMRKGRHDIAQAIERSLKRSLRLQRWSAVAHSFHQRRFVWRFADWLERRVLAGSIL